MTLNGSIIEDEFKEGGRRVEKKWKKSVFY
jgi:hypothetical protein